MTVLYMYLCANPQAAARKRKFEVIVTESAPSYQVCVCVCVCACVRACVRSCVCDVKSLALCSHDHTYMSDTSMVVIWLHGVH